MPSLQPKLPILLCTLLALSRIIAAQTPTPQTLQVNSQLVILDVVVTDKHGAPVANLPRDAFHVFENRIPQQIVSLEESRSSNPAAIPIRSTVARFTTKSSTTP